jgi:hypothetical protein
MVTALWRQNVVTDSTDHPVLTREQLNIMRLRRYKRRWIRLPLSKGAQLSCRLRYETIQLINKHELRVLFERGLRP